MTFVKIVDDMIDDFELVRWWKKVTTKW